MTVKAYRMHKHLSAQVIMLVVFFFTPFLVRSQSRDYQFRHLTTQDGLSQSVVTSILQDDKGFMWFGTRDGLNRYDGYKFTVYRNDPEVPGTISNNYIRCLLKDRKGNLWVGTFDGGLSLYDREKDNFIVFKNDPKNENSIRGNGVISLLEDGAGNIWMGENNGYIDRYNPTTKTFAHYRCLKADLFAAGALVCSLAQDEQGNIWAGTRGDGIYKFNTAVGKFIQYELRNEHAQVLTVRGDITQLYADMHGHLWINSWGSGLVEFDLGKEIVKTFYKNIPGNSHSLSHNDVLSMLDDHSGNLWVGTENGGVSVLNVKDKIFHTYKISDGLSDNSIYSLYKDRSGNIWIGTNSGGLNFCSSVPPKFSFIKKNEVSANSLGFDNVLSILQEKHGKVWIGTDGGGLDVWDKKQNIFHHHVNDGTKNGVSSNYVISLFQDKEGLIWVGNFHKGIDVFNAEEQRVGNLAINNASVVYEDSDGLIWIGTWGDGFYRYDRITKSLTNFKADPDNPTALNNNVIFCILEEGDKLWVGTEGGGLNLWNKNTGVAIHYKHDDADPGSIGDNIINEIFRDSKGNLWVGTNNGLNLFHPEKNNFTVFRSKDGLPNDQIKDITEDDDGNLWLSTNNGLVKFNPAAKKFRTYKQEDGLLANALRAAVKGTEGEIFLGGLNGMNFFNPDSVKDNPFIPPVVITDFQIFNLPVKVGDKKSPLTKQISEMTSITVSHRESVLSFEFAALNYTTPERNQYSYFLEGFDHGWSPVSFQRKAIYTNLDPGEYTFHVKASNNDGVWNDTGAAIRLIITPPFWMTWQFRSMASLLLIGSFVSFYSIRIGTVKKQKKLLEKQVEERTRQLMLSTKEAERARLDAEQANRAKSIFLATMSHEIRTPMRGVLGMASLLAETPLNNEQQEFAKTIQSCGESLLNIINDILDYSKIESGKLELEENEFDVRFCIESVLELFAAKAAENGLDLLYSIEPNTPLYTIGDSLRLRQVLLNLVGNAIKFTRQGEIFITLSSRSVSQDVVELQFEVRDTGIGIPKDKLSRLFKAFSQVDTTTTRKYGGTGLGLVISERLIDMMQGSITVESEEGVGTKFKFSIKTRISPRASEVPYDFSQLEGKCVLVIDDNKSSALALQRKLEEWKLAVVTARSGMEAFNILLQRQSIDLILVDMEMPGMNGLDFCARLKNSSFHCPVILVSTFGDERVKAHADLFNAVITKPIKYNSLLEHVVNQLTGSRVKMSQVVSESPAINAAFASQHPLNILLAEDNPVNQKLAMRVLSKLGYVADAAENGLLALKAISEKQYDLILMDIQMPEMDGLEATRAIRKEGGHQPIIIAMTANAMEGDREVCLTAGMNDYLSKPVKLPELVALIEKWAMKIESMRVLR